MLSEMKKMFNFNWPKKISWKLSLVYTLIFLFVLLVLNGTAYYMLNNYVHSSIKESVNNTLNYILPKLRGVDRNSFDYGAAILLEDISKSEEDVYFRIVDYNKETVAQSNMLEGMDLPLKDGNLEINKGKKTYFLRTVTISKYGYLNGYLQVVKDVTIEYSVLNRLLIFLSISSIGGGLVALLVGFFITKKSMKPVKEMSKTARKISGSDLSKRLEVTNTNDELAELAETFNSMLDRLEKAFKKQEQFVSDASHELRTPISIIKGYINILDRWGKEDKEIKEEAVESIKSEIQSMNDLIESLLFLARGDLAEIEPSYERFYFNNVVEEIIKENKILDKDINYKYIEKDRVEIYADKLLIKQLLRIFIENSRKYTGDGGNIVIESEEIENNIKITIKDDGKGIPKKDIPHIFDRFYKIDKSRSDEKGSSGLGLSIAMKIVELHNGDIDVESEVGEGTKITIFIPLENK
ncbi:MAG TPA: HAMP domain-containing sensor histidine kinase [Halanaerobiales bacterium]|nr:HAMP domain-containing sensor histidine kinase [Halanaerobiales bacterium]